MGPKPGAGGHACVGGERAGVGCVRVGPPFDGVAMGLHDRTDAGQPSPQPLVGCEDEKVSVVAEPKVGPLVCQDGSQPVGGQPFDEAACDDDVLVRAWDRKRHRGRRVSDSNLCVGVRVGHDRPGGPLRQPCSPSQGE